MFSFYKRKHYLKKVTISGFENAKTSSSLKIFKIILYYIIFYIIYNGFFENVK